MHVYPFGRIIIGGSKLSTPVKTGVNIKGGREIHFEGSKTAVISEERQVFS